jgi:hypothetical protein
MQTTTVNDGKAAALTNFVLEVAHHHSPFHASLFKCILYTRDYRRLITDINTMFVPQHPGLLEDHYGSGPVTKKQLLTVRTDRSKS